MEFFIEIPVFLSGDGLSQNRLERLQSAVASLDALA
jgi:hypothetical protein